MSNATHTPGPWSVDWRASTRIVACGDATVASCGGDSSIKHQHAANTARIVACVNALEGLNPEAIPALVEAAKLACAHPFAGNWYAALLVAIEEVEGGIK